METSPLNITYRTKEKVGRLATEVLTNLGVCALGDMIQVGDGHRIPLDADTPIITNYFVNKDDFEYLGHCFISCDVVQ